MATIRNFFHPRLILGALCGALCLVVLVSVFFRARSARFDFDGAYNLQVGSSLAKEFVYRSNYHPFKIYDPGITTNGPIQYLLALALQFFDIDMARCAVVFGAYAAFIAVAFWLSPFSALAASFLALAWPALATASTAYLGDLTAVTFCMAGLLVAQNWARNPKGPFPIWASLLFGFSIATKFITLGFVPLFILYGLTEGRNGPISKLWRPGVYTYISAILIFVATYYFSVLHSYLVLWLAGRAGMSQEIRWHGLADFILSHFVQEGRADPNPFILKNFTFLDTSILIFFLGAAALAMYENIFFGPVVCLLVFSFTATVLTERRLLPLLSFVPLLGARSFWRLLWRRGRAGRRRLDLFFGAIFLVGMLVLALGKMEAVRDSWNQALNQSRLYGVELKSRKQLGRLPLFIRGARYPIVTGGWFQMPEASALTGVIFYDRMDEFTAKAVRGYEKVYLLFRPSSAKFWPYTSRSFCGNILLDEHDFVLCEFDKSQSMMRLGEARGQ